MEPLPLSRKEPYSLSSKLCWKLQKCSKAT